MKVKVFYYVDYRMKRFFLLLVIMFACAFLVQAQNDVRFSHNNMALGYYNPASAGRSGDLDVTAIYNIGMAGWENGPKTLFVSADMPFKFMKKEHGVGVVVVNDNQSSLYNDLSAGIQYAFLKKIGKGTLRAGLQLGMVSRSVGGENVITPDNDGGGFEGSEGSGNTGVSIGSDPAIPTTKVESKVFDANFGLYYATDKWYVGAAVSHILEPEIIEENLSTFINRGYNFIGGYNIRLNNPLFELQPSVFVRTIFNIYQADVTARAVYAKKYSAGLMWRSDGAMALLLGATFGKVEGGYAYSIPTSAMIKGTFGGHELYLKYKMQLNKPKTGKSKHKSVRIL